MSLIQETTGASRAEAARHVRLGEFLREGLVDAAAAVDATDAPTAPAQPEPWHAPLGRTSRTVRDRLDPEGAQRRFDERFENPAFRLWSDSEGVRRASLVFEDMGGAWAQAILDSALRPQRGGPRFVDADERAQADELVADPRQRSARLRSDPRRAPREARLFSSKQRIALAARDGGCRWRGCDRPGSFCEAHHIDERVRDSGRTDVDRGILLCRWHHMELHHGGWRITRDGNEDFVLHPPPGRGEPIVLVPRLALRYLRGRHRPATAEIPPGGVSGRRSRGREPAVQPGA
jgi:hypothetical protein